MIYFEAFQTKNFSSNFKMFAFFKAISITFEIAFSLKKVMIIIALSFLAKNC